MIGLRARRWGGFWAALLSMLIAPSCLAPVVRGDPVPGFVEDWSGTDLHGWGGGSSYSNPGTGGVGGAGDGFLIFLNTSARHLGVVSHGTEYGGDWLAAGVIQVRLWLKDVNARDPLEIHFVIGASSQNVWQYNPGFAPPDTGWAMFTVDLTSTDWTQIIGTGSFDDALRHVDSVHLRHDSAPYVQLPNNIAGDVGVDRLQLISSNVEVLPTSWGRIKLLYR